MKSSPAPKTSYFNWLLTLIIVVGIAGIILVVSLPLSYIFIASPFQMAGKSMTPSLQPEQKFIVNKLIYQSQLPQRGDIIVFHAPKTACPANTKCDFIKRIIGLPGETVSIKDNHMYINNQVLDEPYLAKDTETLPGAVTQNTDLTLSATEYFVVGDNRPFSSDSRVWGPIQKSDIVGKLWFKY